MKKTLLFTMFIAFAMLVFNFNSSAQQNLGSAQEAENIYTKASASVDVSNFEMTQTLTIIDNRGNERVRKTSSKSLEVKGVTKMMIEFISPADVAGTAMLIYDYPDKDDDMWIYLPAMRKTRRIASNEKGQSFMGSEFSNADMTRPSAKDFDFKFLPEEKVNGEICHVIEMTLNNKNLVREYAYLKQVSYISKDKLLTYKVDFYDNSGKHKKEMTLSKYEKLGSAGKYMAKHIQMKNLQNKRSSIITIDSINTKTSIKDADLSPTKLGE
ncbi:MAG: outer membrane lipoprotein-sorting protein [Bacteroidales bacterium]|nr:outer membrane lipoprotein-sorting protein [Bacteroidales bacterium]